MNSQKSLGDDSDLLFMWHIHPAVIAHQHRWDSKSLHLFPHRLPLMVFSAATMHNETKIAKCVQGINLQWQSMRWLFVLLSLILLMFPNTISIGVNAIHLSFKVKASVQSLHFFSFHWDMTSQWVTSSITGSFWGEGQKGRVRVRVCESLCLCVCVWPQWGPYDSRIERGKTSKKQA